MSCADNASRSALAAALRSSMLAFSSCSFAAAVGRPFNRNAYLDEGVVWNQDEHDSLKITTKDHDLRRAVDVVLP